MNRKREIFGGCSVLQFKKVEIIYLQQANKELLDNREERKPQLL